MRAPLSLLLVAALLLSALPPLALAQTTEADVYVQQAILDFDEKRYDDALANLRHALEIEPDHVEALYYMGVVHMARRQPAEAVPFLVRARQKSPTDPSVGFQLGLAYFAQQQYDRAAPLLEEAFRVNPTLDGLGYYVGFMRYRNKKYQEALDAFRRGRSLDPQLQQLTSFYASLALTILKLPTEAIKEVEQAVRLAPGSPLTAPAERLRDTIVTARAGQRRLSAELRVGGFYDDNVAVVPDRTGREPLVDLLRQSDHKTTGELMGLRVDYAWLKHFINRDDLDSTIGYSFFGTYNNDLPDFNVTNHMINAGLTYRSSLGGMPTQTGLQYAWDVLYLNEDEFIQRQSGTLFGALVESDMHLTQAFARYQHKQFNRAPGTPKREFRDGDNYMLGAVHLLRFQQDAHFIKLGYQFDVDDTAGKNFQYRGHRLLAGAQYSLPWGLPWANGEKVKLKYDFDAHIREYTHRERLIGLVDDAKRRRDEEVTNTIRTEIPFLRTCVGKDDCVAWTLSAEYQRTSAASNVAIFDYTRNVFSLILSLTY